MKTIIASLIFLIALQVHAASSEYLCRVRQYQIELTLDGKSTHVWLRNNQQVIWQNYVGWIEKTDAVTRFHFYGNFPNENTILAFKNSELKIQPLILQGMIDAKIQGFLVWDSISCKKTQDK
jgi:hypothetical protein